MHEAQKRGSHYSIRVLVIALLLAASARCGRTVPAATQSTDAPLRIGVAQIAVEQLVENLTNEGLVALTDDGRVRPWLAKDVSIAPDGLSITMTLRPNVRFHDGSTISPQIVADTLREVLPASAGPAFGDVASIEPVGDDRIEIKLRQPSQFIPEALDAQILKPGSKSIGTGSFMSVGAASASEVLANPAYYLQAPAIQRIELKSYPTVRAAWADMLRGSIDMVYEVGLDELDSLQTAKTINVFSFTRRYQYVVIFNSKTPALHPPAVRRALNAAIDRSALVRDAMGGHGLPSSGPIWPHHWAVQSGLPAFTFDPKEAARAVAAASGKPAASSDGTPGLRFTCLVAPDSERVSQVVKRQLEAVGVDMVLDEISHDDFIKKAAKGDFDAIVTSVISGPSIVRPYLWWESKGKSNRGAYSNASVDAALDSIRHATSDDQYRTGVANFQKSILDDPPAIFLAWDEHARAVSNRFDVATQPGTDIMRTLHLWRPAAGAAHPGDN